MMMLDVWPRQRANVTRKRKSQDEVELRQRVRKNKTIAAVKASNARIASDRAERAKQRRANADLIRRNHAEDVENAKRRK